VHVDSARSHEVTLVKATIAQRLVLKRPEHLGGDAAYGFDQLDAELAQPGAELIAPHRSGRERKTQDGRPLRRYRRQWKVERLFAWLQNYRRIGPMMGGSGYHPQPMPKTSVSFHFIPENRAPAAVQLTRETLRYKSGTDLVSRINPRTSSRIGNPLRHLPIRPWPPGDSSTHKNLRAFGYLPYPSTHRAVKGEGERRNTTLFF
jgi:hypothetical protein